MRGKLQWAIAAICLAVSVTGIAAEVTFESLLKEMADLDALASFPDPAYTCKQFASWDRRSTDPKVLTDENWFANGDRGQHLRKETRNGEDEWVLADMPGPGAIVRIWSANANDGGIIRIYLDMQPEPVIEMPLQDMLDGKTAPFLSPISGVRSRGWNTHYPIPYAKHCKITTSKPDIYYQVNYRTYEKGAQVETYRAAMAKEQAELLDGVRKRLENLDTSIFVGYRVMPIEATHFNETIAPEENIELTLEGEAAITNIICNVEAEDMELALRQCVLEITFDDQAAPSVQAPLGDFFGTAPGINTFQSLPCGVDRGDALYSRWVMPFKKSAIIKITNHGDQSVKLNGHIETSPREWTNKSMYFHAKWRAEYDIPTQPRQDWTFMAAQGKGRFVGDMLHVTNPVKQWWGEGDEKIYVDNEAFPSHFGTGSEDYYGYAWCSNGVFTHAYHNQPRCDGPGNYGHTCVSRYHILDNIPFTEAFKFDMEVWHWADCTVDMAATSFWYALPGGTDNFAPIDPADLKIVTPPPIPEPPSVEGALEGEKMKVVNMSGGNHQSQESDSWPWSGGSQLWWTDAEPGQELVLGFEAPDAGRYDVRAVFTKAVDYGVMRLFVNDVEAGVLDFFDTNVAPTPEATIGQFDLQKGKNTLKVVVVGANPRSAPKRYMFGLDYLKLVSVE